jgi:hypothetical protein
MKKSKLAQLAYEESHRVGWQKAEILQTETNSRYRRLKASAHMSYMINIISQPS